MHNKAFILAKFCSRKGPKNDSLPFLDNQKNMLSGLEHNLLKNVSEESLFVTNANSPIKYEYKTD